MLSGLGLSGSRFTDCKRRALRIRDLQPRDGEKARKAIV